MRNNQSNYFDLVTCGIGELIKIRKVPTKGKNKFFLACTIKAYLGEPENRTFRFLDVNVCGQKATDFISSFLDKPADAGMVYFRIGDLYIKEYEKEGQKKAQLSGRLIVIDKANEVPEICELKTSGIGYLNKIYAHADDLYCSIAALCGPKNEPDNRFFNLMVHDVETRHLIERSKNAVLENNKMLLTFGIRNLDIDSFKYAKGERAGETGFNLKAELATIFMIKKNGEEVYRYQSENQEQTAA